jgi:ATP-dependent helicase HrpA
VVALGKDLARLRRELRGALRAEVARVTPFAERTGIVTWDLGTVPRTIESSRDGHVVVAYPTLVDAGSAVTLRLVTSEVVQRRALRSGLRRLLLLAVPVSRKVAESRLDRRSLLTLAGTNLDDLVAQCVHAAADVVLDEFGTDVWDADTFQQLVAHGTARMGPITAESLQHVARIVDERRTVEERLDVLRAPSLAANVSEVRDHLERLTAGRFVVRAGATRLADVYRYLVAIERRLDKLPESPAKDAAKAADIVRLEQRYHRWRDELPVSAISDEVVALGWALEELRVATFAQTLGTTGQVSAKRIASELARRGG